jgi:hypothetical protein
MEELTRGQLLTYVPLLALLCITVLLMWRRIANTGTREQQTAEMDEREKELAAQRSAAVRQGTHDAAGHRLCITCQDKFTRATELPFLIVENHGVKDLVRRWFGAPSRYRVIQAEEGIPVYCSQCASVVRSKHERKVLEPEMKLRDLVFETSLDFRRWMRTGVNDAVIGSIEQHEERQQTLHPAPKRAPVVPMFGDGKSNGNGGG